MRFRPAAAVAAKRTATTSSTLTATTCPTNDSLRRISQKWGPDPMGRSEYRPDNVGGARTPYRIGRPSAAIVSRSWIGPHTGLDLRLGACKLAAGGVLGRPCAKHYGLRASLPSTSFRAQTGLSLRATLNEVIPPGFRSF